MKQILVWSGSALALASIFSTPSLAAGSDGSGLPSQVPQHPVAGKIFSDEEKLQILDKDATAYLQAQGGKIPTKEDLISWFMQRYKKDEALAKIWLDKLEALQQKKKQRHQAVIQAFAKLTKEQSDKFQELLRWAGGSNVNLETREGAAALWKQMERLDKTQLNLTHVPEYIQEFLLGFWPWQPDEGIHDLDDYRQQDGGARKLQAYFQPRQAPEQPEKKQPAPEDLFAQ
ncbi:MAG: hypothetical protein ACRCYZ_06395 [Alphaproteobacteria bacterium]